MTADKVLWIPADLPKFENSLQLVESYTCEYQNQKVARAFDSQQFTVRTENYQPTEFKQQYRDSHHYLINYIEQHLPFDYLVNIKIHRPARQGQTHIDFGSPRRNLELYQNNNSLEPCGYRMVIAGRRNEHLYVEKNKEVIYPYLPDTTDWYIIGSTNVPHGLNGIDTDRFILFCHGYINKEKHHSILSRSIDKYKDYAIWG
jgi:hypothetical protein